MAREMNSVSIDQPHEVVSQKGFTAPKKVTAGVVALLLCVLTLVVFMNGSGEQKPVAAHQLSASGCHPPPNSLSGWSGYLNNFDHGMHYNPSRPISGLYSYHDNGKEDRRWKARTLSVSSSFPMLGDSNSGWTGYINNLDGGMNFQCPANQAIFGIDSYHNNKNEDRQYKVRCAGIHKVNIKPGSWTSYVNNLDGTLDYTCGKNKAIVGINSYHNNKNEDRQFRFRCGSLCAPISCSYKLVEQKWAKENFRAGDKTVYSASQSESSSKTQSRSESEQTTNSLVQSKMKASQDALTGSVSQSSSVKSWEHVLQTQWSQVTSSERSASSKLTLTRAPPSTMFLYTWKLHVQLDGAAGSNGNSLGCAKSLWITPNTAGHPYTVYTDKANAPKCLGGMCQNADCSKCKGDQWMFKWAKDDQAQADKDKNGAAFFKNLAEFEKMKATLEKYGMKCEDHVHCKALKAKLGFK